MKVTIFDGASANQQPISHLEWNSTLKLESTQLSTGTRNLQDENRDEEYATKDDKSAATDCERDVVTQTTQEEHTKQAGTDVLDKEGETEYSLAKFERDMEAFLNKEDATSQQGDAKGVSVPAARKAKQAYSSLKKYAKAKVAARKEEENRRLLRELARAKMAARKADDDDDDASSDNATNYSAIEFLYSMVDTLQDAVEELEERYDADHDPLTDRLNDLVDWYDTFDLMDALKAINGNVCKSIFPNDTDGANPEAQADDQDNARSLKEALTETESVQEDLEGDVDIDEWLMEKKRETKEKFKNADAARKMAAKKQAKKKAEILVSKPAGLMRRGNLGKTKLSIKKP
jgi:hypothetical protein